MNVNEAIKTRLEQIKHDRKMVRNAIRRSNDREVIQGLRKLNNLLEATERALENGL